MLLHMSSAIISPGLDGELAYSSSMASRACAALNCPVCMQSVASTCWRTVRHGLPVLSMSHTVCSRPESSFVDHALCHLVLLIIIIIWCPVPSSYRMTPQLASMHTYMLLVALAGTVASFWDPDQVSAIIYLQADICL